MSGLNSTDPLADTVHGTNPQNLIEKITRLKIYNCQYWKEDCFGLTAESIIDKAISLKYVGGCYGGMAKPCRFLCLLLKLLQLQPERDIVIEFIKNEEFKYLRALGAMYFRMTGKGDEIFRYLEPLYNDFRKLAYRSSKGWDVVHMDVFIERLLTEEIVCEVALPYLIKRFKLEALGTLQPRVSILEEQLDDDECEEEDDDEYLQMIERVD